VRADPERGEISIHLVVVAAVVAALAWILPFVLLGGEQTERVTEPTRGSTPSPSAAQTPQQVTPVGPIGTANDVQAQATLQNAVVGAQVHFAETGSYTGFDAEAASSYEPSVTFTSGPPAPGVVSIRGVTPTTIVFVTTTTSGGYLCAAANNDLISYGRVNALAASQCSGGW
jgi:hypothetical protein